MSEGSDESFWYREEPGSGGNKRPDGSTHTVLTRGGDTISPFVDRAFQSVVLARNFARLGLDTQAAINQAIANHAGYRLLDREFVSNLFPPPAPQAAPIRETSRPMDNASGVFGTGQARQETGVMNRTDPDPWVTTASPAEASSIGVGNPNTPPPVGQRSQLNPLAPSWRGPSLPTRPSRQPPPAPPLFIPAPLSTTGSWPPAQTHWANPTTWASRPDNNNHPSSNNTDHANESRQRVPVSPAGRRQQSTGGHVAAPPHGGDDDDGIDRQPRPPRRRRAFVPMAAVRRERSPGPLSADQVQQRLEQGISLAYRGDVSNPRNLSVGNPRRRNTNLFLRGLPPTCTTSQLLSSLAAAGPFGRIYATSILPPRPELGHVTAAAKVQFYTRAEAQRLFERGCPRGASVRHHHHHHHQPPIVVGGFPVQVRWNHHCTAEEPLSSGSSRVLMIAGPAWFVRRGVLDAYFETRFLYQTESVRVVEEEEGDSTAGRRVLEWRFGSFRTQADCARKALLAGRDDVTVWFGKDPCEE